MSALRGPIPKAASFPAAHVAQKCMEVPNSCGFLAFLTVRDKALVIGNCLDYFVWVIKGSHSLGKPRRDMDAT
jgi:hypothetical protein